MHKFEPLTAVVLVDNNMGIGSGSDILFHCRPFREQQMRILANYPVIMGRTAYFGKSSSALKFTLLPSIEIVIV